MRKGLPAAFGLLMLSAAALGQQQALVAEDELVVKAIAFTKQDNHPFFESRGPATPNEYITARGAARPMPFEYFRNNWPVFRRYSRGASAEVAVVRPARARPPARGGWPSSVPRW